MSTRGKIVKVGRCLLKLVADSPADRDGPIVTGLDAQVAEGSARARPAVLLTRRARSPFDASRCQGRSQPRQ